MKPSMIGQLAKESIRKLERDFAILTLDQKKKNKILKSALKRVKQEANKNKARQQSPDGKAWQPRKKAKFTYTKKGKQKPKKMLAKILNKSTISVTGDMATLGFKQQQRSLVAGRHNYGGEEEIKQSQEPRKEREVPTGAATEEQAQVLLALGFTEPTKKHPVQKDREVSKVLQKKINQLWAIRIVKGVNRKPSSIGYIRANLTVSQAGALIRVLREYHGIKPAKNITPARPFLNEDEAHNANILTEEINKVINLGA